MLLDQPAVRAADTLAAAGRAEDLRGEASGLVEATDPQVARLLEADATAGLADGPGVGAGQAARGGARGVPALDAGPDHDPRIADVRPAALQSRQA